MLVFCDDGGVWFCVIMGRKSEDWKWWFM